MSSTLSNVSPIPKNAPDRTARLARLCADIAYENRATDIRILQVGKLCSYTEYFVIATGRNRNQLRAIGRDTEQAMKDCDLKRLGREGVAEGQWLLLDYGDVVVQLFEPEARAFYQLEELWADAPELEWKPSALTVE
ncbi:MAG: ribosome silencing factor [Alphaproteobacteria bacterium]